MGFTIPNAPTASNIDQAEPDSVDFVVLGDRATGVVSGCAVTASPTPDQNVVVAAGEVVTDRTFVTVGSATLPMGLSDASSPRFDLVVVTAAGAVAKRQGTAGSNPVFPALTAGDVLLAAVYRRTSGGTGTTIDSTDIIDKRVVTPSSIVRSGAGSPGSGLGNVGDVYINTTVSSTTGQSQVWVKTTASLWENLAEFNAAQTSAGTPNTLVLRDASGNFSAGTITATLNGNAATVTNGVYDNGATYGISISQNAATATTATYATSAGSATSATTATSATSASTAAALATSRSITLSGDVTGAQSTDFSSNVTITTTIGAASVENSMLDYASVPQVTVSTGTPTGGKNGDVWITVV